MNLRSYFINLPLRYKIIGTFLSIFLVTITAGGASIHLLTRKIIETHIEMELKSATHAILDTVRTAIAVSIKNHLRSVAETNLELVEHYYTLYLKGYLTEEEAKKKAETLLLAQKIGTTGYIYCLGSRGRVLVHPQKELIGSNLMAYPFVKEQMRRKKGYMEYEWRNPDEKQARPKSLYMVYFQPWDWIVSASSYREEFMDLIHVDDYRQSVTDHRYGTSGYSYVIDTKGNLIIHPTLEGANIYNATDAEGRQYIRELCTRRNGKIIYPWKNPQEKVPREKLVLFSHIPEYDLIVASSGYLREFFRPLSTIRAIIVTCALVTMGVTLLLTLKLSARITVPLEQLMARFNQGARGDLTVRMKSESRDEVGQLADLFNHFMDRLESHNDEIESQIRHRTLELEQEMETRKKAEQALHASMMFFRRFLDTIPTPAFYKDADGIYRGCNKAFCRQIIGLPEEQIIGRSLFDLPGQIPHGLAARYHAMDKELMEKGGTQVYEAEVFCKDGVVRDFQFFKAALTQEEDRPAGIAGVMLDITGINHAQRKIRKQAEEIREANIQLSKLAATDGLTSLKNRRAFQEELHNQACLSDRTRTPLSLIILDIDHFKAYNDTFGHTEGDTVLRQVALLLEGNARKSDLIARYGGEEFVVILPDTDAQGARIIAEKIRKAFHSVPWTHRQITASFGVNTCRFDSRKEPIEERALTEFLSLADQALYQSKKMGRDRVTQMPARI